MATPDLVGSKIISVRELTPAEMKREGWEDFRGHETPMVLVLDNGMLVYASRDDEGNGPGALFGSYKGRLGRPECTLGRS